MTRNRPVVFVIPCGAAKVAHAAPARELYTGSMFAIALAAAERQDADEVVILSAKHGLVDLDTVLDPYDVKMGDPESITVDELAAQVEARGWSEADADVYAMLPSAYFSALDEALRRFYLYAAPVYEATGGIGEQRKVCRIVRDVA